LKPSQVVLSLITHFLLVKINFLSEKGYFGINFTILVDFGDLGIRMIIEFHNLLVSLLNGRQRIISFAQV
jgi:hypothetical protein